MYYLAFIAVDEQGMLAWVQQNLKGLHNALQRNDDRCIFVSWNRHLEVLDPVLFHENSIFQRIVLCDKGANAC